MTFESSFLNSVGKLPEQSIITRANQPIEPVDPRKKTFNFLETTLRAVSSTLTAVLGLTTSVEFLFTDNIKQNWKLKKEISYPRCYVLVSSLNLSRTNNAVSAQKGGYIAAQNARNRIGNQVKVAAIHPVQLSLEFHYFDNDNPRLLKVLEILGLVALTRSAVYSIKINNSHIHQSRLDFEDTIQVPQLELSLDINPESAEIVAPFTVSTYLGSVFDVARGLNVMLDEDIGTAKVNIVVGDAP